ncbi:MAG: hypothetical protein ACREJ3_04605 [Polyangiaceae bacterium]
MTERGGLLFIPIGVAVLLASACSGADPSTLLVGASGRAGFVDASTGSHPHGMGGGDIDSGAIAAGDSQAPMGSMGPGAVVDAGLGSPVVPDTGSAPAGILCPIGGQAAYCQSGQGCCVVSSAFSQSGTCAATDSPCTAGTLVHCGITADCAAGRVCCGTTNNLAIVTAYQSVTCEMSCSGTNRFQFCDPQSNDCPAGKTCTASTVLSGYSVCR